MSVQLNDIPIECLAYLFSWMEVKDIKNCVSVSRLFHEVTEKAYENHATKILAIVTGNQEVRMYCGWGKIKPVFCDKVITIAKSSDYPLRKKLQLIRQELNSGTPPALAEIGEYLDAYNLCVLTLLLQVGADPNVRDNLGSHFTPLMQAAYRGFKEGVRILLQFGADPARTSSTGKTAFDLVGQGALCDEKTIEEIQTMLQNIKI